MKLLDLSKKICLIKQPGGLGDIFYLQKLANHYRKNDYQIYWYVISKYFWIKDYIPEIFFKDKKDNDLFTPLNDNQPFFSTFNSNNITIDNNFVFIPALFAVEILNAKYSTKNYKIMKSKYELCNLDDKNWQDDFNFTRKIEKENDLFYNILGLNDQEEYCLINEIFTPYDNERKNIAYNGSLKKIYLKPMYNFTLFDWCKVIENASDIHIMDSSASLLLDKLDLKSNNVTIYSRRGNNFSEIDYLYKKNYNLSVL